MAKNGNGNGNEAVDKLAASSAAETGASNATSKAKRQENRIETLEAENAALRKALVIVKNATKNNGHIQKLCRDCGI